MNKMVDKKEIAAYTPQQVEEIAKMAARYAIQQFTSTMNLGNCIPDNALPLHSKCAVSVAEASEILGISRPKVYELLESNQIRSVRAGKKILISQQSLYEWINGGISDGA